MKSTTKELEQALNLVDYNLEAKNVKSHGLYKKNNEFYTLKFSIKVRDNLW